MISSLKDRVYSFGLLRLGLLSLAALGMLLPVVKSILTSMSDVAGEHSGLEISAGLIAPVTAPILVVVILFDVIMSRVRAADGPESVAKKYRAIGRIELIIIGIMLAYWIPFFVSIA